MDAYVACLSCCRAIAASDGCKTMMHAPRTSQRLSEPRRLVAGVQGVRNHPFGGGVRGCAKAPGTRTVKTILFTDGGYRRDCIKRGIVGLSLLNTPITPLLIGSCRGDDRPLGRRWEAERRMGCATFMCTRVRVSVRG